MAFPSDLEIEVAFNNDIDETDYAQTGWTSILPFVASFNGDLRGRAYELDRAEAGTLSITLDNGDGRFIPGSVGSPYFPNVKSDRRFRIRGKNMVHPNVARGGSRDRNLTGLVDFNAINVPGMYVAGSTYSAAAKALDSVLTVTATSEDTAGGNIGANAANVSVKSKWLSLTTTPTLTYFLASQTTARGYIITSSVDDPTRDPKSWTVQGSNNGSTWTTLDTQTLQVFDDRFQTKEYTIASPLPYQYYRLNVTANNGHASQMQLAKFGITHLRTDNFLGNGDLSHFFQVTKPANQTPLSTYHRTIAWYAPIEYGVRLTHSAYIWKVSGTEPTGTKVRFYIEYFNTNWEQVATAYIPQWELSTPISSTPVQIGFAHTPPSDAKYGIVSFGVYIPATTNTTDLVYGVTGIQSELGLNLAPDISGLRDQYNWQLEGSGTVASVGSDPATSYLEATWATDDVNLAITIPHLIPGETYTAIVEAQRVGTQPNLMFSGNEGLTGVTISSTSFASYTTTFVAERSEQELQWILQGTPAAGAGLRVRRLNVQLGTGAISLATNAIDSGITSWARPKDIFEGWVESWPMQGGSTEMTITAVDRLKRVGEVELENTLREAMIQDRPVLLMPLTDSMLDTPGRFSQLGSWSDEEGGPSAVDISKSRGDLGISSYTTSTDDGPTEEASLKLSPASSTGLTSIGYFLSIPYSKDFTTKPPVTAPPATPKPPPAPEYVYTKKWYATWSRSYEGDDSTRFDDTDYMYQGNYSGSPGNQKSLAGFDYKNIMSTLSGADILEAYITVENEHARWNKGLYVFVGTHNYSSKPSTWNGSNVRERRWKKWVAEGASVTINIGVSAGNEFKSGSARGMGIGPESDSDNYGYFRGATQGGKPYLTIKYRK